MIIMMIIMMMKEGKKVMKQKIRDAIKNKVLITINWKLIK
jgi:hypothetical protein